MGFGVCTFALLVLLLVAAADAHHKSIHRERAKATHHRAGGARKAQGRSGSGELPLVTVREMKTISYDFGDNGTLAEEMMASGRYDPKMLLPYDFTMDDFKRNRVFITTPLMRRGIPVTLGTFFLDDDENAGLRPYPNLEVHRTTEDTITDCDNQLVDIATTMKTWDDDDKLYAIDNGVLDLSTGPKNVCRPKIVVFNLQTNEISSITVIKNAACNSLYASLWVDACPTGDLTAYASDTRGNVLTVTDLGTGVSKHLQSQYFHPKPGFFFVTAGGPSYNMPHGLYGVTAERSCDGKLYFQALASDIQGAVDKQVLRDASDGDVLDIKTQVDLPGELSGPSGEMVVDPKGLLLFFPDLNNVSVNCWNTTKPHDLKNFRVIARDPEDLEYVSSLNIEPQTLRLYLLSDRFTYYLSNTTNYNETNYRLLYIDLKDIQC